MQNVYDIAHELVRSLKESDQYINYKNCKKRIDENPQLAEMINDFQAKNMQIQTAYMTGQQPDEDLLKQVQDLYSVVMNDPLAAQYMSTQMALSQIINDIYQLIGEALNE